mmetsp:Transcript_9003/g.19899  ORF Transcript_9003/g.19899 Transcript_9003/m.19899 type:complete len:210 (+) Transcript_9003:525-1154(+)
MELTPDTLSSSKQPYLLATRVEDSPDAVALALATTSQGSIRRAARSLVHLWVPAATIEVEDNKARQPTGQGHGAIPQWILALGQLPVELFRDEVPPEPVFPDARPSSSLHRFLQPSCALHRCQVRADVLSPSNHLSPDLVAAELRLRRSPGLPELNDARDGPPPEGSLWFGEPRPFALVDAQVPELFHVVGAWPKLPTDVQEAWPGAHL